MRFDVASKVCKINTKAILCLEVLCRRQVQVIETLRYILRAMAFIIAPMFKPVEVFVGLRYVRAKRRDHFISFISFISIAGVALGVAALITVLSVMNGFEKELTQRILGMASHATISSGDTPLEDWKTLASDIEAHPEIVGVAPYLYAEGMLSNAKYVNGTVIRGVLPEVERKVSIVAERMVAGQFSSLATGEFNLLLGQELARALRVEVNDKVILVMPQTSTTPAGILPRHKRFSVSGIFEIGMHEFDSALALIHLDDAMRLFRKSAPTGLRLKTTDIFIAPTLSRQIAAQLPGYFWVRDWTQQYSNFFRALKTEKNCYVCNFNADRGRGGV